MPLISKKKLSQFLHISVNHVAMNFSRQAVLSAVTQDTVTTTARAQGTQEACFCFELLKLGGCLSLGYTPVLPDRYKAVAETST